MDSEEYKSKGLNQEAMHFCLSIFDFLEALPQDLPLAKRSTLDALTFCRSLKEVGLYLTCLKEITKNHPHLDINKILSSAHTMGGASENLFSFLQTIELLAKQKNFVNWDHFFASTLTIQNREQLTAHFLMTIRHLLSFENFRCWEEFFTLVKRMVSEQLESQEAVLEAIRHSLRYFSQSESFRGIFRMLAEAPQYSEAFAYGQLDSKQWLIHEATKCWGKSWGNVFILAGWIGVLPRMIYDSQIETIKIRSFDIDEEACRASEFLNQIEVQKDWQYKSSVADITKMQYPATYRVRRKDGSECEMFDQPDMIINTSCEHIADIASWWSQIPNGTRVILQSNDGFHIAEHVACFKTLNDFERAMGLSRVDYRGEKALPEFNRFMLIGQK